MRLIPGSLELTQCLTYCQLNNSCKAINYETGLCVLLSTGATQRPEALKPAQFPVFTIYAEKVCLQRYAINKCNKAWVYERVIGYKLKSEARRIGSASTREKCIESCLRETDFECKAVNYNTVSGDCYLLDHDRHSVSTLLLDDVESGLQTDPNFDYLENNCIPGQGKVCEFKKINGLILKTVDSMYPDVTSVEDCKRKCLESPYRCHSFDFGDGSNKVCRTSHLNQASSVHIQDPYLEVANGATYELDNCYNVSLHCGAREMKVKIKMNRPFTGKIYATSKPNSCYNLIKRQYDFDIAMPYNDINCGIMQSASGLYSNNIVIQHHELIVTSNDIGLSINCQYDLSNKKVVHNIQLQDMGDNLNEYMSEKESLRPPIQEATVTSPTVTMRITDRDGNDIKSAEVGDQLSLRFEIPDDTSPYEIFVREVIADDGVDASEFTLIDEKGCPSDISIMSGVRRIKGSSKSVEAPFEAFKFPTSGIVQFRALVVPCLPSCEPVHCATTGFDGTRRKITSLGRRKRSSSILGSGSSSNTSDSELIVIQTIEIVDKFPHKNGRGNENNEDERVKLSTYPNNSSLDESNDKTNSKNNNYKNLNDNRVGKNKHSSSHWLYDSDAYTRSSGKQDGFETCVDINSLVVICFIFLTIQFVIISTWGYIKYRNNKFENRDQSKHKIPTAPFKLSYKRPVNASFFSIDDINVLA
ncbi:uncharacterized protein LOC107365903 isoform X2 [Tetranychus urticae]|nr:uncharacterized protein LOC107365903 isoform X2 [Tetranychus urticae]XP_025017354.1 uncharacterized protein LOC107365903 isoform X2 [Tetranychus urticae]XP_025017355.1 uncharacterized protein LOC107365903 isoform X2 [Tetranychus urticae]